MKNFRNYDAEKYNGSGYEKIEEGIYKTKDKFDTTQFVYVTSLAFTYEEELGELEDAQYPMEDILDEYLCYVSDSYRDIILEGHDDVHEFAASDIEDVKNIRTLIGKRAYNQETEDGRIALIVE